MMPPPVVLLTLFVLLSSTMFAQQEPAQVRPPFTDAQSTSWAEATLATLTLEEKVGQLIMARAFGHFISAESDEYEHLLELVTDQNIGGLVAFQGDVAELALLLNRLQKAARLPLLVAADYERGVAMRIRRASYFPEAMAIGATRNPSYAWQIGEAIAEEARAVGVHQNLAPVADVNNNPENPVINTRSFGEDPGLVSEMVEAFVRGTKAGGAIPTVKHFPGHGDTGSDSHLELPVLPFGRDRLDSVELPSFRRAISSGVGAVMIAHLAVPGIDSANGIPATLSGPLVTGLLRTELGFDGLVVTDAMDMRGILNSFSIGESAVMAFKAGVDIILVPADELQVSQALITAVESGEISRQRVNESVLKILRIKEELGLHRSRFVDPDLLPEKVATDRHRSLALRVAREAVTLLRNKNSLLPLKPTGRERVALITLSDSEYGRVDVNRPSNRMTNEPYGSYFADQFRDRMRPGSHERFHPGSSREEIRSLLPRLERYDLVVVAVYAKVRSGSGRTGLPEPVDAFVDSLKAIGTPVVVISFGNPYIAASFPNADAILLAYSDAEVMIEAAVEALFGEIRISGRIPVTIPGLFAYGSGIQLPQYYLRRDTPSSAGFDEKALAAVDEIMNEAVRDSAFPGCQVGIIRDGALVYLKPFGNLTYAPQSDHVRNSTLYDIASLTKVVGTTAAVMRLYDDGKVRLDDRVDKYLPGFKGPGKDRVTVRHLLTHTSGLPAHRPLFTMTTSATAALDSLYATPLTSEPGVEMVYSDLGMILLGKVVENASGSPLDHYLGQTFYKPLGMSNTMFSPPESRKEQIAPTENDQFWRKEVVQGRVHDENADLLGGVAGHAGLFSTASDLAIFMQMIMNKGTYGTQQYLRPETVGLFTRRESASSTRALGWDTKSETGSSAGDYFSSGSFGHTGFTGTSIWTDPERRVTVIFLTNRVFPDRRRGKIAAVRPQLHDAVVKALANESR